MNAVSLSLWFITLKVFKISSIFYHEITLCILIWHLIVHASVAKMQKYEGAAKTEGHYKLDLFRSIINGKFRPSDLNVLRNCDQYRYLLYTR